MCGSDNVLNVASPKETRVHSLLHQEHDESTRVHYKKHNFQFVLVKLLLCYMYLTSIVTSFFDLR